MSPEINEISVGYCRISYRQKKMETAYLAMSLYSSCSCLVQRTSLQYVCHPRVIGNIDCFKLRSFPKLWQSKETLDFWEYRSFLQRQQGYYYLCVNYGEKTVSRLDNRLL